MTEPPILTLGIILMTASLVAIVSRRLHLPYSAGLVLGGILLALLPLRLDCLSARPTCWRRDNHNLLGGD